MINGPVSIQWKEGAPAPVTTGINPAQAVLFNEAIYVGGGGSEENEYNRLDVYHPDTNRWDNAIQTPQKLFALAVVMSQLVIVGGKHRDGMFTNEVLALVNKTWKDHSRMPTARSNASATSYFGQSMMIVMGGWNGKIPLSTIELLDDTTGQWFRCDNLPLPLYYQRSVVVDDKLYVFGGNTTDKISKGVYCATLTTFLSSHQLKWQRLQDVPWGSSAAVCFNHKYLLAVGGKGEHNTVNVLKAITSWQCIGSLPIIKSHPAAVSLGNKVFVIGGRNKNDKSSSTVLIGNFQ